MESSAEQHGTTSGKRSLSLRICSSPNREQQSNQRYFSLISPSVCRSLALSLSLSVRRLFYYLLLLSCPFPFQAEHARTHTLHSRTHAPYAGGDRGGLQPGVLLLAGIVRLLHQLQDLSTTSTSKQATNSKTHHENRWRGKKPSKASQSSRSVARRGSGRKVAGPRGKERARVVAERYVRRTGRGGREGRARGGGGASRSSTGLNSILTTDRSVHYGARVHGLVGLSKRLRFYSPQGLPQQFQESIIFGCACVLARKVFTLRQRLEKIISSFPI